MKRIAFVALLLSAVASAADFRDVNKTVALPANGLVDIETHKGSVNVSTWSRSEVEIQARIEAEPGEIMDRRRFEGTEIRIDNSADSVHVRTYYPEFFESGSNPQVRYTIKMPKTARLTIRDQRSDTEVTGLDGALDLTTHRGTAHIRDLGGALHLDTYRGDVHVEFSSFRADSSVTSYRGSVDLSMPAASHFDLQTDAGRRGSIETNFTMISRTLGHRGDGVRGTVNGGGPALHLSTERGDIQIHAR